MASTPTCYPAWPNLCAPGLGPAALETSDGFVTISTWPTLAAERPGSRRMPSRNGSRTPAGRRVRAAGLQDRARRTRGLTTPPTGAGAAPLRPWPADRALRPSAPCRAQGRERGVAQHAVIGPFQVCVLLLRLTQWIPRGGPSPCTGCGGRSCARSPAAACAAPSADG